MTDKKRKRIIRINKSRCNELLFNISHSDCNRLPNPPSFTWVSRTGHGWVFKWKDTVVVCWGSLPNSFCWNLSSSHFKAIFCWEEVNHLVLETLLLEEIMLLSVCTEKILTPSNLLKKIILESCCLMNTKTVIAEDEDTDVVLMLHKLNQTWAFTRGLCCSSYWCALYVMNDH